MAEVADHYQRLLADCYSWMHGDFDARAERERAFLEQHGLRAGAAGAADVAVDLGAGSGHQSVALARLGWRVRAIDSSARLLDELRRRAAGLDVAVVEDDLSDFARHLDGPAGAIVCMGDTLTHLPSVESVRRLFAGARASLAPGGALVLTYRDLSRALAETDRFIPVRADDDRILTCFLEYLPEVVRVHDLLYQRTPDGWRLEKSWYPKLRLAAADIERWLGEAGFRLAHAASTRGLVEIVARVPGFP